jgi:protein SHQ1
LTFPGNVLEDERSKATYDMGKGELTVILAKETPGEYFPDLDMLTKLLVRKGDLSDPNKQIKRPLIEVLSSGDTLEGTQQVEKGNLEWKKTGRVFSNWLHDTDTAALISGLSVRREL